MKPGTEITAQRAREFNLLPQQENEDEVAFRRRIAGALRDQGHVIEAHEAFNNELFDQSTDVMTSLAGVAAMALQDVDYGSTGDRKIDDEFASGVVSQEPKDDGALLMLAILLSGGRR